MENYDELQRYQLIKDNIIFNASYKKLGEICEVCKWTHSFLG
jgi:hypothetical protein